MVIMHPCSFPWVYLEVSCSWFSWLCRKLRLGRDVNNFLSLYTVYGVYCSCASREKLKEKNKQDIVEHRLNEGPREWQNLLAITRFRYIEVLSHMFYYYWGKENRSLYCIGAPGTTTTTSEHVRKFYLGKKWAGRGVVGPATLSKRLG